MEMSECYLYNSTIVEENIFKKRYISIYKSWK